MTKKASTVNFYRKNPAIKNYEMKNAQNTCYISVLKIIYSVFGSALIRQLLFEIGGKAIMTLEHHCQN